MSQSERRGSALWALLALVASVTLCFVPLFDLVGYELALAVTPLMGAAALQFGLAGVGRRRTTSPFSAREAADLRPLATLLALASRALYRTLPVLLIPLVVLSLNALRVRNCNPGIGFVWYAVLPLATAGYGATLGVALGVFTPRLTGPRVSFAAALLVLACALGWSLMRLYFAPPIFVFDPLFGYFAGSLYDEHVAVPTALLYARAYHATLALAFLATAALVLDGHSFLVRGAAARGRVRLAMIALGAVAIAVAAYSLGPQLGFRHDARTIARALGGERTTEHFTIHFRPEGPYGKEIDDVATELELRFARLEKRLGVAPTQKVHAYLFSSAAEKQALMGAGRTYIAKPWRREIYVNHEAFPQAVLGHELAHVFGASVGDALLGVARHGLRLDVGLIEGFAEATTSHGGALTPDEVVRVLELLGRTPDLTNVMSPRFWSLPSQQAYAIAGSFCHFLLERSGAPALLALYRAGGERAAYPAIYGASFSSLEAAWLERVHAVPILAEVLERERERILRPSIFRRPCARELARLVELARSLSGAGDHDGARALYAQACADEPDDPGHLDELLVEDARAGATSAALAVAHQLLTHKKASAAQRGAAHSVLGDLEARTGGYAPAAAEYARAEREPTDEPSSRLYTVKHALAERILSTTDASTRAALVRVLAVLARTGTEPADDYARITQSSAEAPSDALLAYLAARQLVSRQQYVDADLALARALAGVLPDARFAREAERLRAEIAFRRRDYAGSAARFDALAASGTVAARLDAESWADRARYFATHAMPPPSMQLAVLVNPRARGVRRDPGLASRLATIVGARGEVITTSPERLPEVCRALCARGTALVALCGGDGTGQATITELLRAYRAGRRPAPALALLRGGTVNTVARNLGITADPACILTSITRALDRGHALPRIMQPILKVNGRHGFLFAAALGARFLELYYEAEEPGPARAAYLAARVSASALVGGALSTRLFRPADVAITVADRPPVNLAARLLVASTVVDVGVGMRICPRATAHPDRFQLIASGLAPSAMAQQLPAVLAGRALVGEPHLDELTTRTQLQFDCEEPYTLDGELFRAHEITIALDETLSIVRAQG